MADQASAWHILDEGTAPSPEEGVAADFDLLEQVATGRLPSLIRLWENAQCLVVSGRDSRLPHFATARAQLAEEGWPVIVRGSGGTAVPHGPGTLLLSMIYTLPEKAAGSIDDGYERLCGWMARAVSLMGVAADFRSVPTAYCDGRYNLAVGDRKIAGTAQRWRKRTVAGITRHAVLAHALFLVEGDAAAGTAAVNRFYGLAGGAGGFKPDSVTTLAENLSGAGSLMPRARQAFIDAAAKESLPQ